MFISILFAAATAFWLAVTLRGVWALAWTPRLPPLEPAGGERSEWGVKGAGAAPSVDVVIAARDEVRRIEGTVRGLMAQRNVDLRIIVVDDRSTDGGGPLLDQLAAEDDRLDVVHITDLPAGWLGKCHALHIGSQRGAGRWLLFMDADVWMAPDVIARAVAEARREQVAHLTLVPGLGHPTLPAQAAELAFFLQLTGNVAKANRDHRMGFVGIGAFNMIRRDVYERIGGHKALRMEVVDDMKLGILVRAAGHRTRGRFAAPDLEVQYAMTLGELLRVLEKNAFAILGYSAPAAIGIAGALLALIAGALTGPTVGLLLGTWWGFAAFAAFFSMAAPCAMHARRLGWSPLNALAAPFFLVFGPLAILNSMVRTLHQGGVRWRERFYPLSLLREGVVSPWILWNRGRDGPGSKENGEKDAMPDEVHSLGE